ncbi:5-methyltetrahydropteroyltriglutamate--homocysteine S-methyltransferase, partial [Nocardia sp. NPDC004722]
MVNVTDGFGSSILGYPRIGEHRQLKRALESYWHGTLSRDELLTVGRDIQESQYRELAATGLTQVPGNTFSFYDHVLDNALLFGAVPKRFEPYREGLDPLDFYFLMARGRPDLPPLELVKLLNTPYHYRQPELETDTEFSLHPEALLEEFDRAKAVGIELRPVVLGPLSLLLLSKTGHVPGETEFDKLVLLDKLLPVYEELLEILAKRGATCVQFDEPCFTSDRSPSTMELFEKTYQQLSKAPLRPRMLVTGQYGDFGEAVEILCRTSVEAIGLDLAAHRVVPEDLAKIPGIRRKRLYAGVISGTNVWRADRHVTLEYLHKLAQVCPDMVVSTGSTLLHVPYDVLVEYELEGPVADRLAFAKQKVLEVVSLAKALTEGPSEKWRKRPTSVHFKQKHAVRQRVYAVTPQMRVREPYEKRKLAQQAKLRLPLVPATTLGSFPQTAAARQARHDLGQGRMSFDDYRKRIEAEIESSIRLQEDIGLDVLVHGEHERNDMIQFFAEQLDGFATTHFGWVQVYGSRCVRPPIVYGDVARPEAMSVSWTAYAQSLTDKPVKGMVTGPVTMLARSFVRQDQPLYETADQVALAIRDEVVDLEKAGIAIIQ